MKNLIRNSMNKGETWLRCFLTQLAWYLSSQDCPFVLLQWQKPKPVSCPAGLRSSTVQCEPRIAVCPEAPILVSLPHKLHYLELEPKLTVTTWSLRRDTLRMKISFHGKASTLLKHYNALIWFMWISIHINLKYRCLNPVGMKQIFKSGPKNPMHKVNSRETIRALLLSEFWITLG